MDDGWASAEFAGAELGDGRCNQTLARNVERLAGQPGVSFSAALGHDGRQAFGRLCQRGVRAEQVLAGHVAATARRCWTQRVVLALQDTTAVRLDGRGRAVLGPLSNRSRSARGLLWHTLLAVTPQGELLGLLGALSWTRAADGEAVAAARRDRPLAEKESSKWLWGLQQTATWLADGPLVLVVCDREGDVYETLTAERPDNVHWLVRAAQARKAKVVAEGQCGTLFEAAAAGAVVGAREVTVSRQKGRSERQARVQIQWTRVQLKLPQRKPEQFSEQVFDVVRVVEVDPPAGVTPLEWVLVTTLPVADGAAAMWLADCYSQRWKIERWHDTLKSGLGIEDLQLQSLVALENAIAMAGVAACRILGMLQLSRLEPDSPAERMFGEEELAVLSQREKKRLRTLREAVRAVAKLGGWRAYRTAPEPGVKVLWLGLNRLYDLVEGWRLRGAREPGEAGQVTEDTRHG